MRSNCFHAIISHWYCCILVLVLKICWQTNLVLTVDSLLRVDSLLSLAEFPITLYPFNYFDKWLLLLRITWLAQVHFFRLLELEYRLPLFAFWLTFLSSNFLDVTPINFHSIYAARSLNLSWVSLTSKFQPPILELYVCNHCTLFALSTMADCLTWFGNACPSLLFNGFPFHEWAPLFVINLDIHTYTCISVKGWWPIVIFFLFYQAAQHYHCPKNIHIQPFCLIPFHCKSAIMFHNLSLSLPKGICHLKIAANA